MLRPIGLAALSSEVLHREDVEQLLAPWLREPADRAFVARCIVEEGPIHHRGSSYALLRMLGLALAAAGGPPEGSGEAAPIALRLPPHLQQGSAEQVFPLGVPLAPLERLAPRGSAAFTALLECLRDGPPHHALANAAMACMIEALLERLEARRGP